MMNGKMAVLSSTTFYISTNLRTVPSKPVVVSSSTRSKRVSRVKILQHPFLPGFVHVPPAPAAAGTCTTISSE